MRSIACVAIAAASLALAACGSSDKTASTTTAGHSKARSTVTVPPVDGVDLATAEGRIRALGLTPVSRRKYASEATGHVVKVYPAEGTAVAPGSKVDLVVSRGPRPAPQEQASAPAPSAGTGSGSSSGGSNGGSPPVNSPQGQKELHNSPDCQNAPPPPPGYTGPVQC